MTLKRKVSRLDHKQNEARIKEALDVRSSSEDDDVSSLGDSSPEPSSQPKRRRLDSSLSFAERLNLDGDKSSASSSSDAEADARNDNKHTAQRKPISSHSKGSSNQAHLDSKTRKKRRKSDAPEELIANVPVSRFRKYKAAKPTTAEPPILDPRFNPAIAKTNAPQGTYDFLDSYRDHELTALKSTMKQLKMTLKKHKRGKSKGVPAGFSHHEAQHQLAQLQTEVGRMRNKQLERDKRRREAELLREEKRREKEKVEHGKLPFFVSKSKLLSQQRERDAEQHKHKEEKDPVAMRQHLKLEAKQEKKLAQKEKKRGLVPGRRTNIG